MEYSYKKQPNMTSGREHTVRSARQGGENREYLQAILAGKARADANTMGHRQDLAPSLSAKMSKAFGMDLSRLQLYRSDAMTGTGISGLTSSTKIVLSKDIDLNTMAGQEVLGHELSHAHAQSQGIGMGHTGLLNDASLEKKADAEGMKAARGQSILGDTPGMDTGTGISGLSSLTPLGAGMSVSAGAPMQAKGKKAGKKSDSGTNPETELASVPDEKTAPEWSRMQQARTNEEIGSAYETLSDQHYRQMSSEQKEAFGQYISESGPINSYLRGQNKGNEKVKNQIANMDRGMQKTGADMKTYRGVSDYALIAAIKQDRKLAKKLITKNGTINYKALEKNKNLLNGLEFSDDGFSSTSVDESFAESWRRGILKREAQYKNKEAVLNQFLGQDLENPESNLNTGLNSMKLDIRNRSDFDNLSNEDQGQLFSAMQMEHEDSGDYTPVEEGDLIRQGYGSHLYDINVPKGSSATMVDRTFQKGEKEKNEQREMLLDRGSRFRIDGLENLKDENGKVLKNQYRILMSLVGQKKKG